MRPQAMVASCDPESGHEVVGNRPDSGLPVQRGPECLDTSQERDAHDQEDIQPVDMFVPVLPRYRSLGDVSLGGVIGFASVGLRRLCGRRRL